ncbi:MAG: carboxypeptidase regulatory-like domain-containing protein [Acidobacteriota bacterium]|nr:carboxypeptidase regulatory-like domain-containing protein [Acidobacteriota bacterium]
MTWRWLICFSLSGSGSFLTAAMLSGTVQLGGDAARKPADYSGVVISAEPLDLKDTPALSGKHAQLIQKKKSFAPHILPVQAGTIVDFPNFDPIFHNAFSSYSGQIFDVGLYPPGTSRFVRFARLGVVRVFCNIHPAMSAVILVLNTPYFTKTDGNGKFQIDLPPGNYELSVFHERATEQTLRTLSRRVQIDKNGLELPPIAVSEAGYLPSSHKNKYGKDYPPAADDRVFYPGARK